MTLLLLLLLLVVVVVVVVVAIIVTVVGSVNCTGDRNRKCVMLCNNYYTRNKANVAVQLFDRHQLEFCLSLLRIYLVCYQCID